MAGSDVTPSGDRADGVMDPDLTASQPDLADRIEAILGIDPDAGAIEFGGAWTTWGSLAAAAHGVADHLGSAGLAPGAPVGLVLRNDPAMIAAMLGVLLARCCIVTLNPSHGDEGLGHDIRDLRLPAVVACDVDWGRAGVMEAATGALGLRVSVTDSPVETVPGLESPGDGPFRESDPAVAVEMLTSGTTGPPKRIPLAYSAFERTISAAGAHYGSRDDTGPRLRRGVMIVSSPLVHMSGLFRTLLYVCQGRQIALLPRFTVDDFIDLVARHRPKAVSLVPTALAMVLDADVDPAVFDSVKVVTSGTAPLSADLQATFEDKYGVAVLPSYGATEFAGGVAGWNLSLHREWAQSKRGSVGRPQPGREIRIVAVDDDREASAGEQGVIEVRTAGGEWVRTTDLGRLDADGFLFIDGRTDDVINRGGFKVTPADIVEALRSHPAVRDAGVTGLADKRLGAVPVAAVECADDQDTTTAELLDYLRTRLSRYQVPADLRIVDELPRTPSMKISQPGIRALFEQADQATS
ncbi:class I adenylate-forming enzyme family protein [Mycolicibacterium gadium]|uniref:Acyl--CoA ligase n=1 Tax=Mycolicibacterium gadium TaxID=1794 RepID=A0ABT6GIH8_MYCGU|nr:class I adenylate-forming enzyme family protein [Mycolicibacterium gadium]MDG5481195.1 acyl--CoA ligase [Mycolicibacterium gadium]